MILINGEAMSFDEVEYIIMPFARLEGMLNYIGLIIKRHGILVLLCGVVYFHSLQGFIA